MKLENFCHMLEEVKSFPTDRPGTVSAPAAHISQASFPRVPNLTWHLQSPSHSRPSPKDSSKIQIWFSEHASASSRCQDKVHLPDCSQNNPHHLVPIASFTVLCISVRPSSVQGPFPSPNPHTIFCLCIMFLLPRTLPTCDDVPSGHSASHITELINQIAISCWTIGTVTTTKS